MNISQFIFVLHSFCHKTGSYHCTTSYTGTCLGIAYIFEWVIFYIADRTAFHCDTCNCFFCTDTQLCWQTTCYVSACNRYNTIIYSCIRNTACTICSIQAIIDNLQPITNSFATICTIG